MKLFNIYTKENSDNSIEDFVAVKGGSSAWAFLFGVLWFLQHKMWKEAISLAIVNAVFVVIFQNNIFGSFDLVIFEVGLAIIVAINANYWHEQYLIKKDYKFIGCVFGKNTVDAKLHFIDNYFDQETSKNKVFCPSIFNLKKPQQPSSGYFTA
jgi:hypothetical protein